MRSGKRRWVMRGRAATAVLALLLVPAAVPGQVVVTSNILTNDTWTASSSPYIIQKTVVEVKNSSTLTIEPGVEVRFQPGTSIAAQAGSSIVAIGSSGDSVRFTSNAPSPSAGDWASVQLNASPASEFRYCVFTYGTNALMLIASDTPVARCAFRDCTFGAYLRDSDGTISRSSFLGCSYYGLWLVRSSPGIEECWITGSGNVGILCEFVESRPVIWHCNLFDNGSYNVQLDSYGDDVTVVARENWWGSSSESAVEASIRDADDGWGEGLVDYSDWLTDVPVEPRTWGTIKALFR